MRNFSIIVFEAMQFGDWANISSIFGLQFDYTYCTILGWHCSENTGKMPSFSTDTIIIVEEYEFSDFYVGDFASPGGSTGEIWKIFPPPTLPKGSGECLYLSVASSAAYVLVGDVAVEMRPQAVLAEEDVVGCERVEIFDVVGHMCQRTTVQYAFDLCQQGVELRIREYFILKTNHYFLGDRRSRSHAPPMCGALGGLKCH